MTVIFVCCCVMTVMFVCYWSLVEADRESGGDLDMCDPCQMPPPGLLEVHEGQCCLSAVPTFCAYVGLFINIFHFL